MNLARYNYKADFVDSPLVTARAHLGYRLTADVDARWVATDQYFLKWKAYIVHWMGFQRAMRYEQEYRARVMSSVGREAILRNDHLGALRSISFLVRRWPKDVTSRAIVLFSIFLIAGIVIDRLPLLRRIFRARAR